jgi:hypothetical protein
MNKTPINHTGQVNHKKTWKQLLQVTGITIVAMPVTILLHEMGHYISGLIFGFPNLVLHYGSVTDTAKEQHFPLWQIGVTAAAGPFITLLFTICCCIYIRRRKPDIAVIILGITAPVRWLIIGFFYYISILRVWIRGSKFAETPNFDEYNIAHSLGISLPLLVTIEIIFLLFTWLFLARKIPANSRRRDLLFILFGIILGIALWSFIGPLLLP